MSLHVHVHVEEHTEVASTQRRRDQRCANLQIQCTDPVPQLRSGNINTFGLAVIEFQSAGKHPASNVTQAGHDSGSHNDLISWHQSTKCDAELSHPHRNGPGGHAVQQSA